MVYLALLKKKKYVHSWHEILELCEFFASLTAGSFGHCILLGIDIELMSCIDAGRGEEAGCSIQGVILVSSWIFFFFLQRYFLF